MGGGGGVARSSRGGRRPRGESEETECLARPLAFAPPSKSPAWQIG